MSDNFNVFLLFFKFNFVLFQSNEDMSFHEPDMADSDSSGEDLVETDVKGWLLMD